MKTKIRIISLLLCLILCLPLVACGNGNSDESSTPESTPTVTPEASTPEASTPEESTPEASTPEETEPIVDYNISYDLDGGIEGGNPTTYNRESEITLLAPVKPGYDFAGWTGTGLTEAKVDVKIEKGTKGDLSFKATWTENKTHDKVGTLDNTYFGKDNGLTANPAELPISTPDRLGTRGEGLHTLKTIYTDINIDGTMDPAYTYGLHFKMDLTTDDEYYANKETTFDAYVVRGQDGFVYVYVVIVDPDLVVNDYIFKNDGAWRVDSIDMYIEIGNFGSGTKLYSFVPDKTGALKRDMPARNKITITETGYVAEFAFDNNGKPFYEYDEIGFGFYLNDANEWDPETKKYRKEVTKNSSVLNPVESGYMSPSAIIHDAFRLSYASASGKVDVAGSNSEKTGEIFADIMNGSASVGIIYDENATAQTVLMAQELANLLRPNGVDLSVMNELHMTEETKFDYMILLNMTKQQQTIDLINALNYNQYGVSVTDKAIAVVGWNEAGAKAVYGILYEVVDYILNGGKNEAVNGAVYSGKLEGFVGDNVPKLDNMDSVTDVGDDAYMMYVLESNLDAFKAYNAKLEAAGYKLHTKNTIATAEFATYYNDDTVINVQYGGESDKSLRVVVEPLANTALPMIEKPADANATVTVSSISQLNPHHFCMVVQLSNGHFIVIDSGNNGRQKDLSDFLRKNAPDGKPVVDAWIFTHFHQDHIGGFVDYMGVSSLTRYITVKSVIYNFPQTQVINTASSTDLSNVKKWNEKIMPAMKEKGTTFYQARTGQKYYFGNAEIEILWSYEDIMPFNVYTDNTNHTCIGFTVTIEGQRLMITGDSTEHQFRMVANKYGEFLKSDMVQLAHHGGGNGGGDHDFYKLVNAPIVFHPNESEKYPSVGGNEKWAINNAELVIRTGNYGTATIKLPFKVGDAITSEKEPKEEVKKK